MICLLIGRGSIKMSLLSQSLDMLLLQLLVLSALVSTILLALGALSVKKGLIITAVLLLFVVGVVRTI